MKYKYSSRLPGIFVWRRRPFAYKQGLGDVIPSLALDSAVGSNSSVAHPGTARQWYRVLYSPHKRNKHHQRVSDGMSTSSKLGRYIKLSLEVAKMFHLLTWVCTRAGFV